MKEQGFMKKDWIIFKNKIANWQEAYMDRLNKEYIELLSEDANPSEKFWRLDKRLKEDRKKTGVQLEMSRSNLIYNITSLINDGAISFEDLEEFSNELKETVRAFIEREFRLY
ncbi:multidrug transporter [Paratissierella segnis]|uniref:Multidrug transporter n=1 Tax=Paratissierella segnis TaxID=2763679 RepID=A0A926EWN3_9FIRM|nr:multidrug transporter [Paratissierella segnis]MBC8587679.1 multidrug transporter [Paratissierella segnis]